ncbi:MAG: TIGR02453 family protein [Gemmatimonas sp.]|nr:TIGR02453 family protein [Gemmatimonas sp.]
MRQGDRTDDREVPFHGFSAGRRPLLRGPGAPQRPRLVPGAQAALPGGRARPGARLRRGDGRAAASLAPQIQFDPRTDGSGSIFRIHRDVRFSKDKSPYKTHLGIFFWEGQRKWGPGFYFHLEPPRLQLYVGKYVFDKEELATWRAAVADPTRGAALARLTAKIEKKGYELGGQRYKRVPAGFAADHPRAELLKHDSVWVRRDGPVPAELRSRDLLDFCQAHFKAMSPLHGWLREFSLKSDANA